MTRLRVATLAALALTTAAAGCGEERPGGEARADGARAARTLERQRAEVRDLTAGLARLTADQLGGVPLRARGRWRGCESAFPEGYRSFRYDADALVEARPAARRPHLAALREALERAGYRVGRDRAAAGGGTIVPVARGGVTGAVSEVPAGGDHVLIGLAGACVDVPAADRSAWLSRTDPDPAIL